MIAFEGGWCASNIDGRLELAVSSSIRKAAASRRTPQTSDTAHKAARIQNALGIQLLLHSFDQGERISGVPPDIERQHFVRTLDGDKKTIFAFRFAAQPLQLPSHRHRLALQ